MIEPRLASGMRVSSLIRRIEAQGGNAAVLSRGDKIAGAIVVAIAERGVTTGLIEFGHTLDGNGHWRKTGPQLIEKETDITEYLTRRRRIDPDLWIVELDIADGERFAAEMIATG
jgi:hypothetical protein